MHKNNPLLILFLNNPDEQEAVESKVPEAQLVYLHDLDKQACLHNMAGVFVVSEFGFRVWGLGFRV